MKVHLSGLLFPFGAVLFCIREPSVALRHDMHHYVHRVVPNLFRQLVVGRKLYSVYVLQK